MYHKYCIHVYVGVHYIQFDGSISLGKSQPVTTQLPGTTCQSQATTADAHSIKHSLGNIYYIIEPTVNYSSL